MRETQADQGEQMAYAAKIHRRIHAGRAPLVIGLALTTLLVGAGRTSAVVVAPHALYMDHRSRSGVFYVHNPSHVPVEIDVELVFGYPVSDPEGIVRIVYFPEPEPEAPSAARFIRALPRRTVVPPGRRQAVRLLATPPPGLPDGEYWSRILVTAEPTVTEAESLEGSSDVQVGVRTTTRVVTSLAYRKGELRTAVEPIAVDAHVLADRVVVDVDMERRGDAAYLGRLQLILRDAAGNEQFRFDRSVAVYFALLRRIEIPRASLEPGNYEIELALSTDRQDIAPEDVLDAPPVIRRLEIVLEEPLAR